MLPILSTPLGDSLRERMIKKTRDDFWASYEAARRGVHGPPPPPARVMRPSYAYDLTCMTCWEPYGSVWWHRLWYGHDPRHDEWPWLNPVNHPRPPDLC